MTRYGTWRRMLAVCGLRAAGVGLVLAVACGPASPSVHAAHLQADDFAAIDRFVEREMGSSGVPGVALAIVRGSEPVHLKGFGRADDTGRPVTPQTPFFIGSVTKSFTALAVMQLAESGKLDLDAPVQRYLPWFQLADLQAAARITVRSLLNQTSGLPSAVGTAYAFRRDTNPGVLLRTVQELRTTQLDRPVGLSFEYCNLNYGILGLIVESVSGEPYGEYIRGHVFEPLEMRNSYADPTLAEKYGAATGYAYWWGLPRPADAFFDGAGLPSGYLISSAEDLAHYVAAQLNDGKYASGQLLSADGILQMHAAAIPAAALGGSTSYGMGWFSGKMGGTAAVWVPGTLSNFRADVILLPQQNLGIVVLINAFDYTGSPGANIAPGVVDLLLGNEPQPAAGNRLPAPQLALLLVFILQLVGIARALWVLRRWRMDPASKPRGRWVLAVHAGLPLVLNLAWAAICLIVLPSIAGIPPLALRFIDIGQLALASGLLALVWSVLRTILVVRRLQGHAIPGIG